MNKIKELTKTHESATKALVAAVKETFPLGSIVRTKIVGGTPGVWIEAEVIYHPAVGRYPHEIGVRNTKTDKARRVSTHPIYGNDVTLISRPENVDVMASLPRARAETPTKH